MSDAEDKYNALLKKQSKTLEEAVAEYTRRYGRAPPKGFDGWYQFAIDNGAIIIDEYDQLAKDMEPFWQLTGKDLRKRCIDVGYLPSVDLVRIENGTTRTIDVSKGFDDSEVGARAKGFRVMLEKFQKVLPDMDFPINEKAEGRILVPWEEKLYSNLTADASRESFSIAHRSADEQWVSSTFSAANSSPIGKEMVMSGSHSDEPAIPPLKLDDCLAPSVPNSKKAKCPSPAWPMPVLPRKALERTLSSPKAPMRRTTFAITLGRTTIKVTSSRIGEPFTRSTPCSHPQKVLDTRIS